MVGPFSRKESRFGGTLPTDTVPLAIACLTWALKSHLTDSTLETELSRQPALRPTDFRLLTLAEARSSALTFLESSAMPVSDLSL